MKTKRYKIEEMIPVIKYYKSNNCCKGIKISLNDEIFTLKGGLKNIYHFLYLLSEIWNDQFERIPATVRHSSSIQGIYIDVGIQVRENGILNCLLFFSLSVYKNTILTNNNNFKIEKLNMDIDCSICLNKIEETVVKTNVKSLFS